MNAPQDSSAPEAKRRWFRGRLRGRTGVVAAAAVTSLAIGGMGFGAGYAVADQDADETMLDQQHPGRDGFESPPDGGMGGPPSGTAGGQTAPDSAGQPDFDGDGQPDDSPTPDDSSADAQEDSAPQG